MPKVYSVSVYLDINTVSCPGVWLCPKGKAFLKICLFGVSDLTKEVDPFFPLVFKERFHFQKVFQNMNSVYELHDKLGRSIISLELLQCPIGSAGCVKLALFNALLSDILHPYTTCFSKPLHTSGIELLFTACKVFPGIIAPKADVSTKVLVTDSVGGDRGLKNERLGSRSVNDDDKRRQHKVCHTKNNTNCKCFHSTDEGGRGVQSYRPVPSAPSEESQEILSHDINESGRRKTERSDARADYDKMETDYRRTTRDGFSGQNKGLPVSREDGLEVTEGNKSGPTVRPSAPDEHVSNRPNIGSWHDRSRQDNIPYDGYRKDEAPSARRDESQQEPFIIDWRPPDESTPYKRSVQAPEKHTSGGRSIGSSHDDRIRQENISSSGYRKDDSDRWGEQRQQQPIIGWRTGGESHPYKASDVRYGPDRNRSCERLLKHYTLDEMNRTNDKSLRDNYFRCFKDRSLNEQSSLQESRGQGEPPPYGWDSRLTGEPHYERVPDRPPKSTESGGCTCLHSYKKFKKSSKSTKNSRRKQYSQDKVIRDRHDQRPARAEVARTAIPADERYGHPSRKDGQLDLQGGEMPPRSGYIEKHRDPRDQPQRIRSRSDMEVFNRRNTQKYGGGPYKDLNYSGDHGRLQGHEQHAGGEKVTGGWYDQQPAGTSMARTTNPANGKNGYPSSYADAARLLDDLQAGEMPPRSYEDRNREHGGDKYGEPAGGNQESKSPNIPDNTGGRDNRIYNYADDKRGQSSRAEPELSRSPVTRTGHAQQDRQNQYNLDRRRDDSAMKSSGRPDYLNRDDSRPSDSRRQQSNEFIPTQPGQRAPDQTERTPIPTPEPSDDDSNDDDCKCPLCKNYQETYKPKTHPCPRFRKTMGMSSKIRHTKSNTGPKKLVPSRRSTVTKTHMGSSRKMKNSSRDCGFAICDSVDHDFIGKTKDIKKFYRHS